MNLNKKSKNSLIIFFIIFLSFFSFSNAKEIKIISKINDEIITNIDVENEYNYLITLNKSLRDVEKNKMLKYARDSLVKEKVKKYEISKFYELKNKNRFGISFSHISNANLADKNPGVEILSFSYHIPY